MNKCINCDLFLLNHIEISQKSFLSLNTETVTTKTLFQTPTYSNRIDEQSNHNFGSGEYFNIFHESLF